MLRELKHTMKLEAERHVANSTHLWVWLLYCWTFQSKVSEIRKKSYMSKHLRNLTQLLYSTLHAKCELVPYQNCVLLGYYAASTSNFLPTFRDNLLVPSTFIHSFIHSFIENLNNSFLVIQPQDIEFVIKHFIPIKIKRNCHSLGLTIQLKIKHYELRK